MKTENQHNEFDSIGRIAGRIRVQFKKYQAKLELANQGVDKEAIKQEIQDLLAGAEPKEPHRTLAWLGGQIDNADGSVLDAKNAAEKYKKDYQESVAMLRQILAECTEVDEDMVIDSDEYMKRFVTKETTTEETPAEPEVPTVLVKAVEEGDNDIDANEKVA